MGIGNGEAARVDQMMHGVICVHSTHALIHPCGHTAQGRWVWHASYA